MKRTSLLIFLLFAAMAADAVSSTGLPTSVCARDFCGPEQKRIWLRFQSSSGLDDKRAPGMYSGVCFHNSPGLDRNRAHYGGVLIQSAGDKLFFEGRFSFFTDYNPYDRLSVENARRKFEAPLDPSRVLKKRRTFASISFEDRFFSRRYWFRRDEISDRLLLVGYFGPMHTILCDFDRNRT